MLPSFTIVSAFWGFFRSGTSCRTSAIRWALAHAQKDDILILAGKGHEDYQVLRGETRCFDEKKIVLSLLGEKE